MASCNRWIAVGSILSLTAASGSIQAQENGRDRSGGVSPAGGGEFAGFDLARLGTGWLFGEGGGGAQAPKPAPKPDEPRPVAGYDSRSPMSGFFLQSPDGKFLVRLNARIQARYTYFAKDEQGEDDLGDPGNDNDESYFELERARIGLSGHFFDPRLLFRIEIDAETDGTDKGGLTDTWLSFKQSDLFTIGIGQFKPAFIREEFTSSSRLQRVERSLANEFFNIDRNIGVWAEGYFDSPKRVYYNVAVTNGIDTVNQASGGGGSAQLVDQQPAFVGKLDFMLLGEDHRYSYEQSDLRKLEKPLLVVGASGVYENYEPGQVDATTFISTEGQVYGLGVDAIFKWKGISLSGEYMGRWYDQAGPVPPAPTFATREALFSHGYTVQGGFFVTPTIELTGRLSGIFGNEGPEKGNAVEVGPGINWFFAKSHNGKFQIDVAWMDISNDLPSNTESLRLGPNAAFTDTTANFSEGEQGLLTRVQMQLNF